MNEGDLASQREEIDRQHAHRKYFPFPNDPQQRDDSGRVICLDCGDPIPDGRLEAVPTASRCVECQDAHTR